MNEIAEKAAEYGMQWLSVAELLSVITGAKAHTARSWLEDFGSLRNLLTGERSSVSAAKGMGDAKYAKLMAALELSRRHYQQLMQLGPVVSSPTEVREFLRMRLRDLQHEVFCCLFLDNRHRVIKFEELFRGTIDGASVHPREVVKAALRHNAAAVIFAHNHPSGVSEPSQADELITKRLRDALLLVEVRVLDHIIVGDGECSSFAERGLL